MPEEYGLETKIHPHPPAIDMKRVEQGDPEAIIKALTGLMRYAKQIPVYQDSLKEGINENFLPRLKGVEEGVKGINIDAIFSDLIRISQLLYLGQGTNFRIDGINRTIQIWDQQNPAIKRLEMGLFGGSASAGLKLWDASGDLTFDLDTLSSTAIQEVLDRVESGGVISVPNSGVGGNANTITLTTGSSHTSYSNGMRLYFKASATSTGQVSVNIDGIGNRGLWRDEGSSFSRFGAGDVVVGHYYDIVYDSSRTRFVVLNSAQDIDILAELNSFDWSQLTSLIPFSKVSGVEIGPDHLQAPLVIAQYIAVAMATVIELNAERITAGILGADHIDSNVQTTLPIYDGNILVGSSAITFSLPPGFTLDDIVPPITGAQPASVITGVGRPAQAGVAGTTYGPWGIRAAELIVGTSQLRPSNAKKISVVVGSSETDIGICWIWRNTTGTELYMQEEVSGEGIYVQNIVAVKHPIAGTFAQTFYKLSATMPQKPTEMTGVPATWSAATLVPTLTENVYKITRTQRLTSGIVVSAMYGDITIEAERVNPDTVPFQATLNPANAVITQRIASGRRLRSWKWLNIDVSGTFLAQISLADAGGRTSLTGIAGTHYTGASTLVDEESSSPYTGGEAVSGREPGTRTQDEVTWIVSQRGIPNTEISISILDFQNEQNYPSITTTEIILRFDPPQN